MGQDIENADENGKSARGESKRCEIAMNDLDIAKNRKDFEKHAGVLGQLVGTLGGGYYGALTGARMGFSAGGLLGVIPGGVAGGLVGSKLGSAGGRAVFSEAATGIVDVAHITVAVATGHCSPGDLGAIAVDNFRATLDVNTKTTPNKKTPPTK
ncbi:MAG: complement resistance protein TraT [Rickettsiales bacterium]|nr:complement resistance protein TraT [Rickettsiales bacterium]